MVMKMETVLGETYEQFMRSDVDSKGRVFGFIVGLRDVVKDGEHYGVKVKAGQCYAWVQRGLEIKQGFEGFGATQRSKLFGTKEDAKRWAYGTAKERCAKRAAKK